MMPYTHLILGLLCLKNCKNLGIMMLRGRSKTSLSKISAESSHIFWRAPNAPCKRQMHIRTHWKQLLTEGGGTPFAIPAPGGCGMKTTTLAWDQSRQHGKTPFSKEKNKNKAKQRKIKMCGLLTNLGKFNFSAYNLYKT